MQDIQSDQDNGKRRYYMIPVKTEINPQGSTTTERLESLILQLKRQNAELKETLADMDRRIIKVDKGKYDVI